MANNFIVTFHFADSDRDLNVIPDTYMEDFKCGDNCSQEGNLKPQFENRVICGKHIHLYMRLIRLKCIICINWCNCSNVY